METVFGYFSSPIGEIEIAATEQWIVSIQFVDDKQIKVSTENVYNQAIEQTIQQLREYFSKERTTFDLPLSLDLGTDFQKKVWVELNAIPFGKTKSYTELASMVGGATMVRAVGAANGRNPWLMVVPCHRVIGADGALVGYAGGLWRKKWLLDFESANKQLNFGF